MNNSKATQMQQDAYQMWIYYIQWQTNTHQNSFFLSTTKTWLLASMIILTNAVWEEIIYAIFKAKV